MTVLLRDVTIGPALHQTDVLVRDGVIHCIGERLAADWRDSVVRCGGGRLVPGLADHHVHLGAWLRAERSTPLPRDFDDPEWWSRLASRGPGPTGWHVIFGLDHHQAVDQALELMDRFLREPALLVHRTGHGALVNRVAADLLGSPARRMLPRPGVLWRRALGPCPPAVEASLVSRLRDDLLRKGVTLLHDATPYPQAAGPAVRRLRGLLAPVTVRFMGDAQDPIPDATHVKVLDPLRSARPRSGPLAVHAVEPEEILAAAEMVDEHGRIEHAAVCPPPLVELIARSGASVCANPGFLVHRREALQPVLNGGDEGFFQPLADFARAGVPLCFGSDAPVSPPDPWAAIEGACAPRRGNRRSGQELTLQAALRAVSSAPDMLEPELDFNTWLGRPADLAVLTPATDASDNVVLVTVARGHLAYCTQKQPEKEALL